MNLTILNDNDVTPAETQTFTYDPVGPLASASSTAYGTRVFTYDAAGNVTQDNRSGTAWNYTINKAGRLNIVKQCTTTKGPACMTAVSA